MVVTTMHSTSSLIHKLSADFPTIQFVEGATFLWSPHEQTVSYDSAHPNTPALILHELSHGLLAHEAYDRDVQLLAIEAAAWEKAKTLAKHYDQPVSEEVIQNHLDTYRDWMHSRSTCPSCTAVGYQVSAKRYSCPACTTEWSVNEAKICGLKRTRLSGSK